MNLIDIVYMPPYSKWGDPGVCVKHASLGCLICRRKEAKERKLNRASPRWVEVNKQLAKLEREKSHLEDILE